MLENDKCQDCYQQLGGNRWCVGCNVITFKNAFASWTSGNQKLDQIIQATQVSVNYLEWIPFKNFALVEYYAKGAFSTIYSGYWLQGPRVIWDKEEMNWTRSGPIKCALKRIDDSQTINEEYLNNILKYHRCLQSESVADLFGITRDLTGCYIFVMKFYEHGNLHQYLDGAMGILRWRDIVDMLWGISGGLNRIHSEDLYHGNLHSGNILVEAKPESIDTRISDIGLYGPANKTSSAVYGVLPFVAPEVLRGSAYTQAADIYSFGIIMWELSAGKRPFCDIPHDIHLVTRICNGERPEVIKDTPEVYNNLMYRCWDKDPNKRPLALELYGILSNWITAICDDPDPSPLSEQFDAAEERKFVRPEINTHASYTSRLIDFTPLLNGSSL